VRRAGTNKLAGAVALFVLQNSKNNDNEAIPFCVSVNQRSEGLLTQLGCDAARSTSGVRRLRLPACVGLSWACAYQGGRHTADRLFARNKQRVGLICRLTLNVRRRAYFPLPVVRWNSGVRSGSYSSTSAVSHDAITARPLRRKTTAVCLFRPPPGSPGQGGRKPGLQRGPRQPARAKTPSDPKSHFGATPQGPWFAPKVALLGHMYPIPTPTPGGSLVNRGDR
jgi:hypothetical protein